MEKKLKVLIILSILLQASLTFGQPSLGQNPNLGNGNQFVCPGTPNSIAYNIYNIGTCKAKWTITNGASLNGGSLDFPGISVVWKDTVGIGNVKVTLSNCGANTSLEGTTYSRSHVLLSLKKKKFDPIGYDARPRQIDFCNPQPVYLYIPHMYVEGTGGIAQPGQLEANYEWSLPPGWKESSTGATTLYRTPINGITIVPTKCAVNGVVIVKGYLGNCSTSSMSDAVTFQLTGIEPKVTVFPPQGYLGSTACNAVPVTFTSTVTQPSNCSITGYTWSSSNPNWTPVNLGVPLSTVAVFSPSGLPADNGGVITAGVTFGCGTKIEGWSLPLFYFPPLPVGPGPNPVCNSAPVGLFNYNSGAVTWVSSQPGIAAVSPSGVVTRNGISSGAVTISAIFSCNVPTVSQNIWVGVPGQPGVVTGETAPSIGGIYQYVCSSPAQNAVSHTWTPPYYGNPVWSQSGGNASTLVPNFYVGSSSGWLQVAGVNACGNSAVSRLRIFPVAGSGGGIQRIAVHPNPASNSLTIQANSSTATTTTFAIASTSATIAPYLFTATLVNTQNLVVKTGSSKDGKLELDLTEVPNGLYFLHVNDGIEITKSQIQVKH